jgi:outer membrane immunogenic protein
MRKLFLGGVAAAAIGVAAENPAHAASPVYNWTGCYIGGNIGGAWAHKRFDENFALDFNPSGTASLSGFVGGGQIGCDVQSGMWVFGVEGLFDWASMSAESPFFNGKGFRAHVPWFAAATGRVGYLAQPALLIFVRGGAAFVRDEFQHIRFGNLAGTADTTRTGGYIGGGFEWMVAPFWTITVEYGYMDFGNRTENFHGQFGNFSERIGQNVQVVLVSLNYRFGSGGR